MVRLLSRWRVGVAEAAATIARNPLRSTLAAVAVAAAVATTVLVQSGLEAVSRAAREASERAFGSDTFVLARVASGNLSRRELLERLERNPSIRRSDVRFLDRVADRRVTYAATAQRSGDIVAGGRTFENATINGTQATLSGIRDIGIEAGRFLTPDEEVSGAQVVVVGRAVTDELFPGRDPLGQQVRIARRAFRVVGVQARQGTASGVSLDRYAWIPITAFERVFGPSASLQLFAKARNEWPTVEAEEHARVSMRARRGLRPGLPDTFDLITPEASRSFVEQLTASVALAGPPISVMALIASIVVVANTTLVSVAQRTREIGIRRAMGAARGHVLAETVAESILISVVGGLAGLGGGALVLSGVGYVLGLSLVVAGSTAAGSLTAAAASGVVAGWYPARRAAAIDPIRALRSE